MIICGDAKTIYKAKNTNSPNFQRNVLKKKKSVVKRKL